MSYPRDIFFPTISNLFPEEANNFAEQSFLGICVYKSRQTVPEYNVVQGKFYWVDTNKNHIPFFGADEIQITNLSGAPTNTPTGTDAQTALDQDGVFYTWDSVNEIWVATAGNVNIYTADGTLVSDRVLTGDGFDLSFVDIVNLSFEADSIFLTNQPTTSNSNLRVLSRNETTGEIEEITVASLISGADTNFATTDLTFTGNRLHDGDENDITLENFGNINLAAIDDIFLEAGAQLTISAPTITLANVPPANTTTDVILVRNEITGHVEQRDISTLGFTINDGSATDLIGLGETLTFGLDSILTPVFEWTATDNLITLGAIITGANDGDVLTLNSGVLGFAPVSYLNIYNSNGTLTGNRSVDGDGNRLQFQGMSEFNVISDSTTISASTSFFLATPGVNTNTVSDNWVLKLIDATTGEAEWVAESGGLGTVTSFSAGNMSPIFSTNVATATTTPSLTFSLSNAAAYTILGNNTNASAQPTYFTPVLASALFRNQGTTTTVLHGNASGNPSWGKVVLTTDVSGNLPVTNLDSGTNANSTTFWRGDGTWASASGSGIALTDLSAVSPLTYNNTTGVFSTSMATNRLIGRSTGGTGVMEQITIGSGLLLSGGTLSATGGGSQGLQDVLIVDSVLTQDNTIDVDSFDFTIGNATDLTLAASNLIFLNSANNLQANALTIELQTTDATFGDLYLDNAKASLSFSGVETTKIEFTETTVLLRSPNIYNAAASVGDVWTLINATTGESDWAAPSGGSSYTDEEAQDAVGGILTNGGGITWTYNDGAPSISGVVSISSSSVTDFTEAAQDAINSLLTAGSNITLTYNDVANTLTIAADRPTWQETLIEGSTLSQNNTITGGDFDFRWAGMNSMIIDGTDNQLLTLSTNGFGTGRSNILEFRTTNTNISDTPDIKSAIKFFNDKNDANGMQEWFRIQHTDYSTIDTFELRMFLPTDPTNTIYNRSILAATAGFFGGGPHSNNTYIGSFTNPTASAYPFPSKITDLVTDGSLVLLHPEIDIFNPTLLTSINTYADSPKIRFTSRARGAGTESFGSVTHAYMGQKQFSTTDSDNAWFVGYQTAAAYDLAKTMLLHSDGDLQLGAYPSSRNDGAVDSSSKIVYVDSVGKLKVGSAALPSKVSIVGASQANTATDTLADVTGLLIAVTSGVTYHFRIFCTYDSSSTAVGSRWTINGPTLTSLAYESRYSLSATSETFNNGLSAYQLPAAANGTSAATTGNTAFIEGTITPSASGNLQVQFAREGAAGSITFKNGVIFLTQIS